MIGTQFSNLVKQFVSSFVNPLLSLVGGTPDFGNLTVKAGKATFTYGQFLTEALTFLISALVVYYAMVMPVSRLLHLLERNRAATTRDCPECTMSIPVAAQRCPAVHGPDHPGHRAAPAGQVAPAASPWPASSCSALARASGWPAWAAACRSDSALSSAPSRIASPAR